MQKLATIVFTFVSLTLFAKTIFDRFGRIAVWTLHSPILQFLSLLFQQRQLSLPIFTSSLHFVYKLLLTTKLHKG